MKHIPEELWDQLVTGILMNLVAQEERHVLRVAALAGRDLDDDETIDQIYRDVLTNVIKRFPGDLQPELRAMLAGDAMRETIAKDTARYKNAPWVRD